MEVPIISRVGGFGAGINWLHSPSLFSRVFARSGIDEISTLRSFWTWGALILAVVATFSSLLKRTKVILIRLQKANSVISQPLHTDESDEDDDDDCSSASSDSPSDDEVRFRTPKARYEDQGFGSDADFRVADSGGVNSVHDVIFDFKPRFPCLAGTAGEHPFSRNVVKLWDGLGFGSESSGKSVSIWDTNRMEKIRSFFTEFPAICSPLPSASPAVVVSAGGDETRKVRMSVWDLRTAGDAPAMVAQWEPRGCRRELFGMASGSKEKVYVGDGVKSVTVRDLRNVETAFGETEEVTWFDANPVMIDGAATAPLRGTSTSRTNLKRGSINGSVCK